MTNKLTSKALERATNLSGSYLRRLVRNGVLKPDRDSSGRFIYGPEHIQQVRAMQAARKAQQSR